MVIVSYEHALINTEAQQGMYINAYKSLVLQPLLFKVNCQRQPAHKLKCCLQTL